MQMRLATLLLCCAVSTTAADAIQLKNPAFSGWSGGAPTG